MSEYYDLLTPAEKQVYCKIINNVEGKTQKQLADEMFISKHTIHTHLLSIYAKTGTKSQIELIVKHYHERGKLWKQQQKEQ
jgi:NarL family two-component system response regulator LiaR